MVRNIIGIVVGIIIATVVNMALISIGHMIMPPPAGVDLTSMESLAATIHLFGPMDYVVPFLAHALGPLVGTFVAMVIAVSHKMKIAIGMGIFFLLGGMFANVMIPAPMWYKVLDLVFAYIPMSLLGAKLGGAGKQ